jgi:predicted nucleotidyltransferase
VPYPPGLAPRELDLIRGVLARHPAITGAILFGSRAKGTAGPASDVDLALEGIADPLQAAAVAGELEELPLRTGSTSRRWPPSGTVPCSSTSLGSG